MSLLHHTDHDVIVFYLHACELDTSRLLALDTGNNGANVAGDPPKRPDEVAAQLVVSAVWSLLGEAVQKPSVDDKILIAVDEGGASPELARALCAARAEIVSRLRTQCFGGVSVPIHVAIAGTGVKTNDVRPASDGTTCVVLEPCPEVWKGHCAQDERVASVLPEDEAAPHTPLQRLARHMASNARAAAVLVGVIHKRNKLWIRPDTDDHLIHLCAEVTEELQGLNGLRIVYHPEMASVLVHAAFLQATRADCDLSATDFNVIRRLGVLNDTKPPTVGGTTTCMPAVPSLVMDPLRRYVMPDVFTAWLHFVTKFGLKTTAAGDGFEEAVAEYASLALIAPQGQSYFDASFWAELYKRRPQTPGPCWRHPFELFDFIATLGGRDLQAGCTLIRPRDQTGTVSNGLLRDAGNKTASSVDSHHSAGDAAIIAQRLSAAFRFSPSDSATIAAQLTSELPLHPNQHNIVLDGPESSFADVMIIPRCTVKTTSQENEVRPLILVQCKDSSTATATATATAPTSFTALDLFVDLYTMGSGDALSYVAHLLDATPDKSDASPALPTVPFEDALDSVDACVLAALVRLGSNKTDIFAVAMEIMYESNLTATVLKGDPSFARKLRALQVERQAADVDLLRLLTGVEPTVPPLPPSSAKVSKSPAASQADVSTEVIHYGQECLVRMLERATAERVALKGHIENLNLGRLADPLQVPTGVTSVFGKKLHEVCNQLLLNPDPVEAALIKSCFKLTAAPMDKNTEGLMTGRALSRVQRDPNPNKELLHVLEIAHGCRYAVSRVVVVWQREVEDVPWWCLPQGEGQCLLIRAEPWDDKVWPPTNLYPLVDHTTPTLQEPLHAARKWPLDAILYRTGT